MSWHLVLAGNEKNILLFCAHERVMSVRATGGVQAMAKGQVRSNKEVRKPKKDKVADKPAATLGSQVKQSESQTKKK
jgi:hypothetical protein